MRKSKPGRNAGILALKLETLTNRQCSPRTARAALAYFEAKGLRFADEAEAAMRIATYYRAEKKFPRLPEGKAPAKPCAASETPAPAVGECASSLITKYDRSDRIALAIDLLESAHVSYQIGSATSASPRLCVK